ncbi:MAG: hypothetical protein P0S95_01690 [Rhabdochlamydiaceae bacterium]|nr:hypothetical protein [Candidatus Amphrikana amoebophyrae]
MAGITAHNSSSSDPIKNPGASTNLSILKTTYLEVGKANLTPSLISVDEADDFFDPFSKLNTFLAKKVKEAIDNKVCSSNPTFYCEHQLMNYILPQFKELFPQFCLGSSALKRVWETVVTYYSKISKNPHLLKENGEVEVSKLIRDSISQIDLHQLSHSQHPYTYAYKIAKQVAQCCQILNETTPSIEELSQLIWTTIQHLIPRKSLKQLSIPLPLDPFDKKLIAISLQLSNSCKSEAELNRKLLNRCSSYQNLSEIEDLTPIVKTVGAITLKPTLKLFSIFSKKTLLGIETFIEDQINRYLNHSQNIEASGIVSRVISLYRLTAGIEKNIRDASLEEALDYIDSISSNIFTPNSPNLNQSIYSFINSEIIATRRKLKKEMPFEDVIDTLNHAFEMTAHFPRLNEDLIEELSIWTYTIVEEKLTSLSKIKKGTIKLIECEVIEKLIANPNDSFDSLVRDISKELEKIKQVINTFQDREEMFKRRCCIISNQNDMSASLLYTSKSSLFQFIKVNLKPGFVNKFEESVISLKKAYIKQHPTLCFFVKELEILMIGAIKQHWYNQRKQSNLSTHHFFIAWHGGNKSEEFLLKKLPLVPCPGSYAPKVAKKLQKE